jgi:hypothetical protein
MHKLITFFLNRSEDNLKAKDHKKVLFLSNQRLF